MNIPTNDIEKWKIRLREAAPAVVLREMAKEYDANKSKLGFMLSDLSDDISTSEVQAVWGWDIGGSGRGLSDSSLNEILSKINY